jgi:hypothetical protein
MRLQRTKARGLAAAFLLPAAFGASVFSAAVLSASCAGRGADAAASAIKVVAITPSEASAPRQFRGAEAFVADYASSKGKSAAHAVYPGSKGPADPRAIADFIVEKARDPAVAALIVAPAPEGTAEGFRRAKAAREGASKRSLLCIAADSSEDALSIESSADLVVDLDRIGRAYIAAWAAKKMGASAVVAAYSLGEKDDPAAARERAIMEAASARFGLKYAAMIAPKGVEAAAFARAGTGAWLRDFGPRAALYCSDAALVEPLLAGAVAGGGIVAEAAGEATRTAWAKALGVDFSEAKGDPLKERRLLERAAESLGLEGRLGLWDSGYGEASVRGLGEFAMRASSGAARKDDLKVFASALDARSGGAAWIADYAVDPDSGVKSANHLLIRQDVYVLGRGYLQSALQSAPPELLALGAGAGK